MKFKFIHSKKGYGKTQYIFDDIKKNHEDRVVILVPSHNTFYIENRLIDYFGEQIFSRIEIMDFKKLTLKILNTYKGFKLQRISDIGKNLLINRILRNLEKDLIYFKQYNQISLSDDVLSILIDLKNFNVTNSDIEQILVNLHEDSELYKKLNDILLIRDEYESYLSQKYLDPLDDMVVTNSIIKSNKDLFQGYKFYIDGFEVFTYYQYEFLKIVLGRVREINLSLTIDSNDSNLIYTHMKNMKHKILNILFDRGYLDIEDIFLDDVVKDVELKHLDKNYLKCKFVPYNKTVENICVNKCLNNFHEIEELCKHIRELIIHRGYRYNEIGILCRNIDDYENFIKVCFDEFNIPYFIDKKNEIHSNIFVVFLTSLFEVFDYNFSYTSLFKYIKSGLIDIDKDKIFEIENFAIENGINGYGWTRKFNENVKIKYSMSSEGVYVDSHIDSLEETRCKIISPLVNLFSDVKDDNNVNYFIMKIYEFLEENSILNKIRSICNEFVKRENFIYADEIIQTVNSIFDIFDEINNVFKDEIMSFSEFGKILLNSFCKIEISHVPMRADEIIIGDITRLMIGNYKALFIIGCISTNFPKIYKTEDILSDFEKQYLKNAGVELSGTNIDKNLSERYLIYSALNIPREFLYVSYPISNMDSVSLTTSPIISKIKQIFPRIIEKIHSIVSTEFDLCDISSERETLNALFFNLANKQEFNRVLIDLYNFYKNKGNYHEYIELFFYNLGKLGSDVTLSQNIIEYFYKDAKFSVSSIETYSKCSFKYFIDYIMRVRRRKSYSFDSIDYGNLVHFLMENICKKIKLSHNFKTISDADIRDFVDIYFENDIFSKDNFNYILNTSSKFRIFGNKIRKIIKDSLVSIAKHSSESEFFHKFYEFEFGNQDSKVEIEIFENKKVRFVGKIDRVDFCRLGENVLVNIIDYKSSVKTFDYGKIYQNLNIQTIAYMKYIIEIYKNLYDDNIYPCGVFYFTLHSPNIKDMQKLDLVNELYRNYKYEGIFTDNLEKLLLVDKNLLRKSSSNILPIRVNKDGKFSKNISSDRLLSDDEFNDILDFVHDSIKIKLEEIFKGNINVYPTLESNSSKKCLNCDYLGICKFSKNTDSFKIVINLSKDEFFNLIKRGSNYEVEFESE